MELPVDDPILIDDIYKITEDLDFMDYIKASVKKQSMFSAQGMCKFLVFNIKNHKINEDRWNHFVSDKPQTFQFFLKTFEKMTFWQRVECSEVPHQPKMYKELRE